jgi:hypothetical protein
MLGEKDGVGRYPIIWGINLSNQKNQNREMGGPSA